LAALLGFISMARRSSSTKLCPVKITSRAEPSPTDLGATTTRIEVFVNAPSDLIERAAQAGATDIEPVTGHDAPWGPHRQGGFTDPFGHRWSVGDRSPLEQFPR
jgi:PhnB protein